MITSFSISHTIEVVPLVLLLVTQAGCHRLPSLLHCYQLASLLLLLLLGAEGRKLSTHQQLSVVL
jgi:hypothetical protein